MSFGIANFLVISVLCYVVGDFTKKFDKIPNKFIPDICMIVGGILGVICFILKTPDFPANDIMTAIAVGVTSGGTATAINQAKKQLFDKKDETVEE
jgi:hypothetical protein